MVFLFLFCFRHTSKRKISYRYWSNSFAKNGWNIIICWSSLLYYILIYELYCSSVFIYYGMLPTFSYAQCASFDIIILYTCMSRCWNKCFYNKWQVYYFTHVAQIVLQNYYKMTIYTYFKKIFKVFCFSKMDYYKQSLIYMLR